MGIFTPLQFDLFGLMPSLNGFILLFIMLGVGFGLFSRKASIGAFGGFLVYVYIVMNTDLFIYNALLYILLVIVTLYATAPIVTGYLEGRSSGSDLSE